MPILPLLVASAALLPGLWEYQSSLGVVGGKAERKCLSKAEVERFLTDPGNRRYDCDYSTRQVADGKVRLKGVCTSRKHPDQKIGVSAWGAYTSETIELKGQGTARVIGALELPITVSFSAHRVSADCPAAGSAAPGPAEGAGPG